MRRLIAVGILLLLVQRAVADSVCVLANPSDGFVQGISNTYATANSVATGFNDFSFIVLGGSVLAPNGYQVNDGFLSFPNLGLPAGAIVTSATLTFTPFDGAPQAGTLGLYDYAWAEPLSVGNAQTNFTGCHNAPLEIVISTPGTWFNGVPVSVSVSPAWIGSGSHVQYCVQDEEDVAGIPPTAGNARLYQFYSATGSGPVRLCATYVMPTGTPTPTGPATATVPPGSTPTRTPRAVIGILSGVPVATNTNTPLPGTPTRTPTLVFTPTFTQTRIASVTPTQTGTATQSGTPTPTFTPTQTRTFTLLASRTPTRTASPTFSPSPTAPTPTFTITNTPVPTNLITPTRTPRGLFQSLEASPGPGAGTPTFTPTITRTSTVTFTPTDTPTHIAGTDTPTGSPTETPTETPTQPTATPTPTREPCCVTHSSPSCEIGACNTCVCVAAGDSFCCSTAWDQTCVDAANGFCASSCACVSTPTATPTATPTVFTPTPIPPTVSFCTINADNAGSVQGTDTSYPPPTGNSFPVGMVVERGFTNPTYIIDVGLLQLDTSSVGGAVVTGAHLTFPNGTATLNPDGRNLNGEYINPATYFPISFVGYTTLSLSTAFSVPLGSVVDPVSIAMNPAGINHTGFTAVRLTVDGGQPTGANFAFLWDGVARPGPCLVLDLAAATPTPTPSGTPCCGQPTPTPTPTLASVCVPFTPTPTATLVPGAPTLTPTPLVCCDCGPSADCQQPLQNHTCPTPCVPVLNGVCGE